jgi:hypothetical protein
MYDEYRQWFERLNKCITQYAMSCSNVGTSTVWKASAKVV